MLDIAKVTAFPSLYYKSSAPEVPAVALRQGLQQTCFAVYYAKGPLPRLNTQNLHNAEAFSNLVVLDVDNKDVDGKKKPWNSGEARDFLTVLKEIDVFQHAGFYSTAHGFRILYGLRESIHVLEYDAFLAHFLAWFTERALGAVDYDKQAVGILRLFRSPLKDAYCDFGTFQALDLDLPTFPRMPKRIDPLPIQSVNLTDVLPNAIKSRLAASEPLGDVGHRDKALFLATIKLANAGATLEAIVDTLAPSVGHGDGPTAKDLAYKAKRAVERANVHTEHPKHRILHMRGDHCWVWSELKMRYVGPYTREQLQIPFREAPDLVAAVTSDKGDMQALPRILGRFGGAVQRVVMSYLTSDTEYIAAEEVLRLPAARVRDLEPRFDPLISVWLKHFGGDQYEKLLDWLATVTDLSRPTTALYLYGQPGSGKNLLQAGVQRLWSEASISLFESVTGDFNETLLTCPLVVADEGMGSRKTTMRLSNLFRTLVSNHFVEVRQKHKPTMYVEGAIRLMILANNFDALSTDGENLTYADRKAIIDRVLCVEVPTASVQFLSGNGVNEHLESWIKGDLLARHLLWLRDNRAVRYGPRFIVEGNYTQLHRRLDLLASIGEIGFLVMLIVQHVKHGKFADAYLHIYPEGVLVKKGPLVRAWSALFPGQPTPTIVRLSKAIANVEEQIQIGNTCLDLVPARRILAVAEDLGLEDIKDAELFFKKSEMFG